MLYSEIINYKVSFASIFIAEKQHYAKIYTFPIIRSTKICKGQPQESHHVMKVFKINKFSRMLNKIRRQKGLPPTVKLLL